MLWTLRILTPWQQVSWSESPVTLRIHPADLMALPSIINERKNHANFQLIIITHDENFLRKLGQGDVMDYYWYAGRKCDHP